MGKFDIQQNTLAADRLLAKLTNPRHQRIISNYRRHALLEVAGEWEGIFDSEMTVKEPAYFIDHSLFGGKPVFGNKIREIYQEMKDTTANVIVVKNEQILVGDYGFAHEADFHQYVKGADAIAQGVSGLEADAWYRVCAHVIGIWWYDEDARLIGERGSSVGQPEFVKIPEEDVITSAEAREKLLPLLNKLTPYSRSMDNTA